MFTGRTLAHFLAACSSCIHFLTLGRLLGNPVVGFQHRSSAGSVSKFLTAEKIFMQG